MGVEHLHPWKPGVSGNPGGRPKLPEALRGIHSLSQLEVTKIVSKYARMNHAELVAVTEGRAAPMLELAIAQIFVQSAKYGDHQRLSFLLDRAIGKVPAVDLTDEETEARRELQGMTDRELLQLVKDKIPELEKAGE